MSPKPSLRVWLRSAVAPAVSRFRSPDLTVFCQSSTPRRFWTWVICVGCPGVGFSETSRRSCPPRITRPDQTGDSV